MRGRLLAGASGFGYATWRPAFYPAGSKPGEFLREYAHRLPSVELNATGRRLPTTEQLERWASMTPPDFRFSVKLTGWLLARPEAVPRFAEALEGLGERLGPVLVQLPPLDHHDGALVERLARALPPKHAYAVELKSPAWDSQRVREALAGHRMTIVNERTDSDPFSYQRMREPPYSIDDLEALAATLEAWLDGGRDACVYFKHEEAPTAPEAALRLLELMG